MNFHGHIQEKLKKKKFDNDKIVERKTEIDIEKGRRRERERGGERGGGGEREIERGGGGRERD